MKNASVDSGKGQVVAYIRVSARDQNLDTQIAKVKAAGADRIFQEKASGAKDDRKVLADCLAYLRAGDVLIITRADRIARSAAHLLTVVKSLKQKGVAIRFLDQPELNTEGKYADFLLTVLAAVGQLERDILDEKRRDGIAAARAKGVKFGRPRKIDDSVCVEARELKQRGLRVPEIARRLGLGKSTTYRLISDSKDLHP